VTSFVYVQMMPSKVGSGVEVRQTMFNVSACHVTRGHVIEHTFGILEREDSKTVILSSI